MQHIYKRKLHIITILLMMVICMNCYMISASFSTVSQLKNQITAQKSESTCEQTIQTQNSYSDLAICPATTTLSSSRGEACTYSKSVLRNFFDIILNIRIKMMLVCASGIMSVIFIVAGIRIVFEKILTAVYAIDGRKISPACLLI